MNAHRSRPPTFTPGPWLLLPALLLVFSAPYFLRQMGQGSASQPPSDVGTQHGEKTVVLMSDTHGLHLQPAKLRIPPGDLLIVAGDVELRGQKDWDNFLAVLAGQPHKHKIVSFGNMDMWTETLGPDAPQWSAAEQQGVTVIRDSIREVDGLKVFSSPWTPKYYGAYQLADAQAAEAHWARLLPPTTEVDIIITHGPPHGFGDNTRGRHAGDKALLAAVQALQVPPRLWVCGHIHDGRGIHSVPHPKGPIQLINSAVAHNQNNRPEIQPFVVGLAPGGVTGVSVGAAPDANTTAPTEVWKAPPTAYIPG